MVRLARGSVEPADPDPAASPSASMQQASLNSIDGDWSEAYITPRYYHSAIYDPMRDRMVVFGGDDGAYSGWRNDVWALVRSVSTRPSR